MCAEGRNARGRRSRRERSSRGFHSLGAACAALPRRGSADRSATRAPDSISSFPRSGAPGYFRRRQMKPSAAHQRVLLQRTAATERRGEDSHSDYLSRVRQHRKALEFAKAPLDLETCRGAFRPPDSPAKPAQLGGFPGIQLVAAAPALPHLIRLGQFFPPPNDRHATQRLSN